MQVTAEAQQEPRGIHPPDANERRLEGWLLRTLCEPVLPHIPHRLHPNHLSLLTHLIAWLTTGLALWSTSLPRGPRSLALAGAGVGMLASMVGDCLDGMHARRTGRCSKLGELLDHGLDAAVVPLSLLGVGLALQMPAWGLAATAITASMIYHAQLLLHHHTGDFLNPDSTTGVEAQFCTALGYLGLAGLYLAVDPAHPMVRVGVVALAALASLAQLGIGRFYYKRLRGHMAPHLYYAATCAGLAVLLLGGHIGTLTFCLLLVLTSSRISGTYVLHSLVGRRFSGVDRGLSGLLLAMLALHLLPLQQAGLAQIGDALPYLTCLYLLVRNALDWRDNVHRLSPEPPP